VIYLDNAATTAVDARVARTMIECLTQAGASGNPASQHVPGRVAAALVERARADVAALIGAAADTIVFTSGATESNNLAILGTARANADRRRHLVTSRIEHRATLDPCRRLEREGFTVTWLDPDASGVIDPRQLSAALRPETLLVSLQHVNSEIGVVQDIAAVSALCHARGVLLHADLAQSAGKLPLEDMASLVDFASITAHKIHGPKGIGALYVASNAKPWLAPILFGGGQERGLRPGTLATHQIAGFGHAAALARAERREDAARLHDLRDRLREALSGLPDTQINGTAPLMSPAILNVSFGGIDGESLLAGLPELAVSRGSACNAATGEPSYVLRVLGRSAMLANSSLRFSLGRYTTAEDIDHAAAAVVREVTRLRAVAP
jgi:cysteine desulfurase